MSIDPQIRAMKMMFAHWQSAAAANAFPKVSALTLALESVAPNPGANNADIAIEPKVAKLFATAAVEIWQRAVQSLLVSVAVTDESKLWSSVSGYYATHYTFRCLAHLMGHYQLFQRRWMVHLTFDDGRFTGAFKRGRKREHEWYRDLISSNVKFKGDAFFANAPPPALLDVVHRDWANYADHLSLAPRIQSVNKDAIKARLQRISRIESPTPGEFTRENFPDIETVQINAYHRIVRCRQFLDQALDNKSRLWDVHRAPGWATEYTDFYAVEARGAVQR